MSFRNVTSVGQALPCEILETNLIAWLNWNLLTIGGYFNITIPQSGVNYGGQPSILRAAVNPNYTNGQVWESYRKQWVWQNNVGYSPEPIQISGIFVNNVFQPTSGIGPYKFEVDYANGRVIFNSPISLSSKVKIEYSPNYYQIYNTACPFWRDIQRNSFRIDDSSFSISASGIWSKNPEQRIQLPAVIVQATNRIDNKPYQLGNLSYFHAQDFRFYTIAETDRDVKFVNDAIRSQGAQLVGLFDNNLLYANGVFPLNLDGSLNSSLNYPDMVNNYGWNRTWSFRDAKFQTADVDLGSSKNIPLFSSCIISTVEVITG